MLNLDIETLRASRAEAITIVTVYELDWKDGDYAGNEKPLRFTSWDEPVVFGGHEFTPIPIKHGDISQSDDGKLNDVTITVGNADRMMQYYIENYELIGKRVTIRQFFFGKSNGMCSGTFSIKGVTAKKDVATFSLSIGIEFLDVQFPNRIASSRFCQWPFRGQECQYRGPDASCSKTFDDCKRKGNSRRFGGFPGILNQRFYF